MTNKPSPERGSVMGIRKGREDYRLRGGAYDDDDGADKVNRVLTDAESSGKLREIS